MIGSSSSNSAGYQPTVNRETPGPSADDNDDKFPSSWSWSDVTSDVAGDSSTSDKQVVTSESEDFLRPNLLNNDRFGDRTTTTTTTSTTVETTTKLSSWYQDLFANLIAANTKPRTTTTTPPITANLVTASAEIELFIGTGNSDQSDNEDHDHHHHDEEHFAELAASKKSIPRAPVGNLGLSVTNRDLDEATRNFVNVNNDVGLKLYRKLVEEHPEENLVFCPVAASSALAMIFLGARGSTSWEINELLELDKMITFNPHLLYKNISDTLTMSSDTYQSFSTKNILLSKVSYLQLVA